MGINISKHTSIFSFTVALFLYATMVVDIYRKLIGVNTLTVRNVVYIISLALIVWDMIKTKHFMFMVMLGFIMSLLFLFSSQINSGNNQVYYTAWMLFVTRLWPAFYIGRYTDDWASVSVVVRKFLWIALLYAGIAYVTPFDNSGGHNAYATIAQNLFFVVIVACYDSFFNKKKLYSLICIVCFFPILFLGTRACMFGAMFALVLIFGRRISKSSMKKKVRYYALLIIGAVVATLLFSVMTDALLDLLPNSRSLRYLIKGEMFEDSNRFDSFYSRLIQSLQEDPMRMRGLLGDQIFLAGNNASLDIILSSYAHNVYLELCMNFGLIAGIILGLVFTAVLWKAFKKSKYRSDDTELVFLGTLGMCFVNMLVSFSWLHAYEVWFLFGLAYGVIRRKQAQATTIPANNTSNLK